MKRILFGIFVLSALGGTAWADDYDDPSRGVARISLMQGDVSVRRGDSGEVTAAAMNAPLMSQDALRTGPASRAEIQLDFANFLRVAQNSEVHFADVERGRSQIQIAAGTVTFTVMGNSGAQVEVDTPSVGVHPNGPGALRVTVREDGTTEITVRSGQAEVFTPKGSETIREGETMLVRGPANDPEFQTQAAIGFDEWDEWNQQCDQRIEHAQSAQRQYVSPEVYGTESMDGYGQWVYDPSYGYVWQPAVAPGWAPYRYGRWVWEDWYGWTWVSYDPWGWAPYHWGRWYYARGAWFWNPGGPAMWRPALVGFFGFGPRVGFGLSFGFGFANIGWVPLGPGEAFFAWWGRGFYGGRGGGGFVNNVGVFGAYRNARVMNGITAMGAGQFGRAGLNGNNLRVTAGELRTAGIVHGQVPLTPGRESLRMSDRPTRATGFSERGQFYSHMQTGSRRPRSVLTAGARSAAEYAAWRWHGHRRVASDWRCRGTARRLGRVQARWIVGRNRAGAGGWQRFGGTPENRGSNGYGGQPVHIAPQIVHERPSASGYGGYPSRGGYGSAAPRNGSARAPSYHAPASSGGHSSGGGAHSGGGGGGHNGGGGGHR
jgi:hypothetical protein